jgi:hypothetical protein
MLRNMFGAKFELIAGFPDGSDAQLAMERGEVEAVCPSVTSIESRHPDWLKTGQINPLVVIGLKRVASLPNTPSVMDLATNDEQRSILKMILGPQFAGRPVLGPPAIPAERVAALRGAFDAAVRDRAFLSEMQKTGLGVDPASGAEVEALVKDIYAAPKNLVEKMNMITVKPRDMKVTLKEVELQKVTSKLSKVQGGGRVLVFDVKGKASNTKVSGSRTAITIAGNKGKRGDLKPAGPARSPIPAAAARRNPSPANRIGKRRGRHRAPLPLRRSRDPCWRQKDAVDTVRRSCRQGAFDADHQ